MIENIFESKRPRCYHLYAKIGQFKIRIENFCFQEEGRCEKTQNRKIQKLSMHAQVLSKGGARPGKVRKEKGRI